MRRRWDDTWWVLFDGYLAPFWGILVGLACVAVVIYGFVS